MPRDIDMEGKFKYNSDPDDGSDTQKALYRYHWPLNKDDDEVSVKEEIELKEEPPFEIEDVPLPFKDVLLKVEIEDNEESTYFKRKSSYSNKAFLKTSHISPPPGEASFQCSHCDKAFSLNSTLKQHLMTHTGEKPYQCRKCNTAFSQKETLILHLKAHTEEEQYQCSHCDKIFSRKSILRNHLKTHKEKPYQCSNCDKGFSHKNVLKTHLYRTHSEEKPHSLAKRHTEEKSYSTDSVNVDEKLDSISTTRLDCCCQKLKKDASVGPSTREDIIIDEKLEKNFSVIQDHEDPRIICIICNRYSTKVGTKFDDGGEWVETGVSIKNLGSRKNQYLKRHIESILHLEAKNINSNKEHESVLQGRAKKKEIQETTKNTCIAGQYLVDMGNSPQQYGYLATFLSIICKDQINPLGNTHHGTRDLNDIIIANNRAINHNLSIHFSELSPFTLQPRKHTMALDKWTAAHDATRQVIMSTCIVDGEAKETLISADRIFQKDSSGCLDHLTYACTALIDHKDIVVVCTNGEGCYAGDEAGMASKIESHDQYDPRLLHLRDVSHQLELLFGKNLANFVKTTLADSAIISNHFSSRTKLTQHFYDYNISNGTKKKFTAMYGMSETRYILFSHKHIESILRNLPILREKLPDILTQPELIELHDKAQEIHNIISDPKFIGRLLLCNIVFIHCAFTEQTAQKTEFNMFEWMKIISQLHSKLENLEKGRIEESILNFLETGKLLYKYRYKKQDYTVEEFFSVDSTFKDELLYEFKEWVNLMLNKFKSSMTFPEPIERLTIFFHRLTPHHLKRQELIWCFNFVNLNFMKCDEFCKGYTECNCVNIEIDKFSKHFNEKTKDTKNESEIDYTKVLGTYLSDKEIIDLNIININRMIEVALLMKPTQSSTEIIHSMIANIVDGKYDGQYVNPEIKLNMVNPIVCYKFNCNIEKLDSMKARKVFVGKKPHGLGHRESQWKTKDKLEESKTVKRMRRNLLGGYEISKNRGHKRKNPNSLINSNNRNKKKKPENEIDYIRHRDEEDSDDEGLDNILEIEDNTLAEEYAIPQNEDVTNDIEHPDVRVVELNYKNDYNLEMEDTIPQAAIISQNEEKYNRENKKERFKYVENFIPEVDVVPQNRHSRANEKERNIEEATPEVDVIPQNKEKNSRENEIESNKRDRKLQTSGLNCHPIQVENHAEERQFEGNSENVPNIDKQGNIQEYDLLIDKDVEEVESTDYVCSVNKFRVKARKYRTVMDNFLHKALKEKPNEINCNRDKVKENVLSNGVHIPKLILNDPISKLDKIENIFGEKVNDLYCVCKEPYSVYIKKTEKYRNKMVECEYGEDCKSFKYQMETENKPGANWFHFHCVRFKTKFMKRKGIQTNFVCKKCNPPKYPKKRLDSYLTADGHYKESVTCRLIVNMNDLIYITICQYEERSRNSASIDRIKRKIKDKSESLCNSEYIPESQSEKNAHEAIQLLLKNNNIDSIVEEKRCIFDYLQRRNIDEFNMLVLYIYSVVAEKDIYILGLMLDKTTYMWTSILKETNSESCLSFVKEKNKAAKNKFNIVRHKKGPPKDGQKYLCTNPGLKYSKEDD